MAVFIMTEGINVEHAKKFFSKNGSFENYPKALFIKDISLLLKRECDVSHPSRKRICNY